MTDQIIMEEYQRGKSPIRKKSNIIRLLKFYLLPGWRDPEFTAQQDKIEMIKSKRRLFNINRDHDDSFYRCFSGVCSLAYNI